MAVLVPEKWPLENNFNPKVTGPVKQRKPEHQYGADFARAMAITAQIIRMNREMPIVLDAFMLSKKTLTFGLASQMRRIAALTKGEDGQISFYLHLHGDFWAMDSSCLSASK